MIKPITPPNVFKNKSSISNNRYAQLYIPYNPVTCVSSKNSERKKEMQIVCRNYVGNNNVSKYRMEQLIEH